MTGLKFYTCTCRLPVPDLPTPKIPKEKEKKTARLLPAGT